MRNEIFDEVSKSTGENEFYNKLPNGYRKGRTKYVVIVGSVISGIGKGTISASLGNLLKLAYGFNVAPLKFDGYLNYDAGTLNPYRHGEVFVLDGGTECDLDLGSYERMLNQNLSQENYLTAGKIFKTIIDKERKGEYLGRDVQFIPHVTGEIKNYVRTLALAKDADIVLIEVGGTVGDLENAYFIEAMRELAYEEGKENVCVISLAYIISPSSVDEQKTKAAQLGIKRLQELGIQPDIIVARSDKPVTAKIREKLSVYSNVPIERVINSHDIDNIHKIPIFLQEIGLDVQILKLLNIERPDHKADFQKWKDFVKKIETADKKLTIAIAGKYTNLHDSYISILKALEHAGPYNSAKIKIKWLETTDISTLKDAAGQLSDVDGLIVPIGWGSRGSEGKVLCVQYARENKLPFLGLCYGFQMAIIEYARNICGLKGANSTEIDPKTPEPVVDLLPEQKKIEGLGGTLRLGGQDVQIKPNTMAHKIYGSTDVRERFRHRWECNPEYIETLEKHGMIFSGKHPKHEIMQILELKGHPFFFATQFHPEYTSKPLGPNPVYMAFVKACIQGQK